MNQNCHLVTDKQIANEEHGQIFIKGLTEGKPVIPPGSYLLRKVEIQEGLKEWNYITLIPPLSLFLDQEASVASKANITASSLFL